MCQQKLLFKFWQQLILSVCLASAVVAQVFCTPVLDYLAPHHCFCILVPDISIARLQYIKKSLSSAFALRTGDKYISSYPILNITLILFFAKRLVVKR